MHIIIKQLKTSEKKKKTNSVVTIEKGNITYRTLIMGDFLLETMQAKRQSDIFKELIKLST